MLSTSAVMPTGLDWNTDRRASRSYSEALTE